MLRINCNLADRFYFVTPDYLVDNHGTNGQWEMITDLADEINEDAPTYDDDLTTDPNDQLSVDYLSFLITFAADPRVIVEEVEDPDYIPNTDMSECSLYRYRTTERRER